MRPDNPSPWPTAAPRSQFAAIGCGIAPRHFAPKPKPEICAMRRPLMATTLVFAAAAAMTLVPESGFAQSKQRQPPQDQSGQVPLPQGGFKPPPAAPIKPY